MPLISSDRPGGSLGPLDLAAPREQPEGAGVGPDADLVGAVTGRIGLGVALRHAAERARVDGGELLGVVLEAVEDVVDAFLCGAAGGLAGDHDEGVRLLALAVPERVDDI